MEHADPPWLEQTTDAAALDRAGEPLPEAVGRLRFKLYRLRRKLDKAALAWTEVEQELARLRRATEPAAAPYGLGPDGRPKTKRDLRREARARAAGAVREEADTWGAG